MSAWLGCWGLWNFACFLWAVDLCYFLFPAPAPVLSARASILTHWHSTFPLPAFSCSDDSAFHSSSSFAFPSSHPLPSCPILPQIWGFDSNFPSDPFLNTFLCFLKCWSCFAVFLFLFHSWREPVQKCPRSSDHIKNVTNGSWWKRDDKAQAPAEGWGWVKWFW